MERKIIAIHGLMGHGKDTLGLIISNILKDKKVFKKSFALKVKENISNITGILMLNVEDYGYSNNFLDFSREQKQTYLPDFDMTLGVMLQKYATEACRDNVHKDIWAIAAIKSIPKISDDVFIFTDLRFENEIHLLKKEEGVTFIKIKRNHGVIGEKRNLSHESEKGLSDKFFDFIIDNNGNLNDLSIKATKICQQIKLKEIK